MRGGPLVGVLALQGDVREHERLLAACGARPVRVRRPEELDGLDGLVLPGGESTAIGRLLAVTGLLEPLRDALAGGLPAYGSCAGMVLLARRVVDGREGQPLLGALDVTVRRNAFGRQVDSCEAEVAWPGLSGDPAASVTAVLIRAPWVEEVGEGVEVLARLGEAGAPPGASGRVLAVRQGQVLATAFHPELAGDARVHAAFVAGLTGGGRRPRAAPRADVERSHP